LKRIVLISSILLFVMAKTGGSPQSADTPLWGKGIPIIPYPQSVVLGEDYFRFPIMIKISLSGSASDEDFFTANELIRQLKDNWGIKSEIVDKPEEASVSMIRVKSRKDLKDQGYRLEISAKGIIVTAREATGLFYGIQSLLQLIQVENDRIGIRGMIINDWPDIPIRAVHYDTKHFQEKKDYVFNFIRVLAGYKINMLIWEWEDKFAYRSHPEIGAPGAFTKEEMQEFTRYAQNYHIQIVPLIQGLGHVSFILKHPENKNLREIPSNSWGFCPLRESTYTLMSDLIKEAVEATPGSEYIHIGCDETYVLGKGTICGCKEKAEKEGKFALMEVYVNRVAGIVKKLNRQPMAWDGGYNPDEKVIPVEGLFTPGGFNEKSDKAAIDKGYLLYIYDPNPGIEHLFLPYFYRENEKGQIRSHLEESYSVLTEAARSGKYRGMISTSWNCSGVHNQIWMLRYITAAEYSWNGKEPGLQEFVDTYFKNYYGTHGHDINELFMLLNKASYYYMSTFERKVWHWGEIGKTHLPDLPRNDMEFDPFWNTEYADMIRRSIDILPQMERVLTICKENLVSGVKNAYDFELFEGLAKLFMHTANTYLALSDLEKSIAKAASTHYNDSQATYNELNHAVIIIEENLVERNQIFTEIKATWEKSQHPKGMSTTEKKYLHARDEQHNFANRRPDLTFMIYDEEKLGLEGYLQNLRMYIKNYKLGN